MVDRTGWGHTVWWAGSYWVTPNRSLLVGGKSTGHYEDSTTGVRQPVIGSGSHPDLHAVRGRCLKVSLATNRLRQRMISAVFFPSPALLRVSEDVVRSHHEREGASSGSVESSETLQSSTNRPQKRDRCAPPHGKHEAPLGLKALERLHVRMVSERRLELPRDNVPLGPQPSASTNSATPTW